MSKLTRVYQKIFGGLATNNGQVGSALLGTKVLSNDIATLQALPAYEEGWLDAVITPQTLPPLEEMQAIEYINTRQLAYLFQEGIPEYDSSTTYYQDSIVKEPGTYNLYGSLTNINVGNPLTDITNWVYLRSLLQDISVTMGFEQFPSGRKIMFNGSSVAKNSGGTFNSTQFGRMYTYLWNNISDTYAPVASGRGISAQADFDGNKALTMPNFTNMSPMQVGTIVNSAGRNNIGASTVTSTGSVSVSGSTDSHTLSISEMPSHTHQQTTATVNTGSLLGSIGQNGRTTPLADQVCTTLATGGGGGHSHGLSSASASYTGNSTSVVHPVFGVYYYINY